MNLIFNCSEDRSQIRDKAAVIAVPFEKENPETVAPVEAFFERCLNYMEMMLLDRVIVPGVTKKGEVADKVDIMKTCFRIGKRFEMEKF